MSFKKPEYAELRARSHYSFLRGASHPFELIEQASTLGLKALALTDRDGVYGIPKAHLATKEFNLPRFLIVGSELALDGKSAGVQDAKARLFLIAKDRQGYGVMCRLLTESHRGREKGDAALDWNKFTSVLSEYGSQGLIAMPEGNWARPDQDAQSIDEEKYYGALRDLFPRNFYFPISRFLDGWDQKRTEVALSLSKRFDIPLVATNDVHAHVAEKRQLQDVLTSIREGAPLRELGTRVFSNAERHLKSPEEMARLFSDLPEAITKTVELAEQCSFSPSELRYHYPSEWIPVGKTALQYLEELTFELGRDRYPNGYPTHIEKMIRHELALIEKMKFADYFLTIYEVVKFARERKILCQGRGSAANSVVCYCLGITAVDPDMIGALFERFISEERDEPPDIDVDFEHERREEVIQHIYEKYGRDRAGMVANIITYRSKSSLREVSKAFGMTAEQAEAHPQASRLIEEIRSFPRHLGIHSGGFTLSAVPIIETVPIEPARMEGRTIVQWDKDDLAVLGLLKVDILALGMLTAIRKTIDLVNDQRLIEKKEPWDLASIPKEDPETYGMIQRGETVGVFQIESRAQMGMLKRLLPAKFYDLVIQVAIVRPGPIVGNMVHPFLRRRRGEEKVEYHHEALKPILEKTLGVPIFQEQVMKMAISLAGFTPGEADELRRAINAWKSKGSIEKMGLRLKEGLLASGLPEEFVERIFMQIQGFAEYGFPESHAASFALLAYASSYLKHHYPAEFNAALINSQPMGFYSSHTLIEEAKRGGAQILPVDINRSDWDCEVIRNGQKSDKGVIRVGLRVVRGMNKEAARALIETRKELPFQGLMDFLSRTRLSPQALSSLAMGEAFSCFGLDQRQSLWEILAYRMLTKPSSSMDGEDFEDGNLHQMNLFEDLRSCTRAGEEGDVSFKKLSDYQAIRTDYQVYGLSTRGHPMKELRKFFSKKVPAVTTGAVRNAAVGRVLRIAGLTIVRQRPPNAKGTCFGTLEDEEGFLDLILHNDIFEKYRDVFVNEPFIVATGKVQRDLKATSLLVTKIEAVTEVTGSDEATLVVQSKNFS